MYKLGNRNKKISAITHFWKKFVDFFYFLLILYNDDKYKIIEWGAVLLKMLVFQATSPPNTSKESLPPYSAYLSLRYSPPIERQ